MLLVFSLLLGAASGGVAEDAAKPIAVVAVGGCAKSGIAQHARSVREELERRRGSAVRSEADTAAPLGGLPRGSLSDLERLIASARYDFQDKGAFERAKRTLETALEDAWSLPLTGERWKDVCEIRTLLAWAYVKLDRRAEAEAAFRELLKVDPAFRPDPNLYPPSLRAIADGVRGRLKTAEKFDLRIETVPSGQPIFVDGRPLGTSPSTLKLVPGEYRVQASFHGRNSIQVLATVSANVNVELHRDFEGAVVVDAGPCLESTGSRDARLVSLVRLASIVGADELISVREDDAGSGEKYLVASAVNRLTGEEAREARVKLYAGRPAAGAIAGLADFLTTGSAAPPVEPVRGATPPVLVPSNTASKDADVGKPPAIVESQGRQSRVVPLILGGAGLAALAGGGAFFLQASAAQADIEKLRLPGGGFSTADEVRYGQLSDQIGSGRTASALLTGVGAAAVIGAVVTYVLAGDSAEALRATPGGSAASLSVSF